MNRHKIVVFLMILLVSVNCGCISPDVIAEDVEDNFTKIKRCMAWDGVTDSKRYNCNDSVCYPDRNETENTTIRRDYIDWVEMNKDIITESIERDTKNKNYTSASLNINFVEYSFDVIDYDLQIRLYNKSYFYSAVEYHHEFESTECVEYIEVFQKDNPNL